MSSGPRKFTMVAPTMRLGSSAASRPVEISTEWPVESIVALCEPVFASDSDTDEISRAMNAIQTLIDDLLTEKTEDLRAALEGMVNAHHKRSAFSGRCACPACVAAVKLLESGN